MNRSTLIVPVVLLAFAACSSASHAPAPAAASAKPPSNGQVIFQTGRDASGVQTIAQHPALRQSCAACHGATGAGGVHLPGGAVSADLRYKALVTTPKHPYTLALIEKAIATGIDNNGQSLNPVMPRWKLSKKDLHDVAYYVLHDLK